MKAMRFFSFCALLSLTACRTDWTVEPEGFLCDVGNVCPEGLECRGGVCLRPILPPDTLTGACENVACGAAPVAACVDNKKRTFEGAGSCVEATGQCEWRFVDVECPNGCVNGECRNESQPFQRILGALQMEVTALDISPSNVVLAVGPRGQLARYDAGTWQILNSPTQEDLKAVYFADDSKAWVVGASSTVLEVTGSEVKRANIPFLAGSAFDMVAVNGRNAQHVVALSKDGTLLRFNGSQWLNTSLSFVDGPWQGFSISVSRNGLERVLGLCGTPAVMCMTETGPFQDSWTTQKLTSAFSGFIAPSFEVASEDALVASMNDLSLWQYNQGILSPLSTQMLFKGAGFAGITQGPGNSIYALTKAPQGRLYRSTRQNSESLLSFPNAASWAMSLRGQPSVAVSETRGTLTSVYSASGSSIGTWAFSENWVSSSMGPGGTHAFLSENGSLWLLRADSSQTWLRVEQDNVKLRDLALGETFHLAVGDAGQVFRVEKEFRALQSGSTGNWNSVCRVSDAEFYLAGDNGRIRGYNGTEFSTFNSSASTHLRHVSCRGPKEAVACGDDGTVVQLSESGWQRVSPAFPLSKSLSYCERASDGSLWVAGSNAFYQLKNGVWTPHPALSSMSGVLRVSDAEFYAVADGNSLMRFDGTTWKPLFTASRALRTQVLTSSGLWLAGDEGAVYRGTP